MSCEGGPKRSCLCESLCENINSLVTIYTDGGCCFTGLLVSVGCDCCKLVTTTYPRGGCCGSGGNCNRFGKVTVIPINEIVAVTFCNTSV